MRTVLSGSSESENKGGNSQGFKWKRGNATEPFSMSACSRHQAGGAVGEQDQSKCPCSGMSPRTVSFNNPGLWSRGALQKHRAGRECSHIDRRAIHQSQSQRPVPL